MLQFRMTSAQLAKQQQWANSEGKHSIFFTPACGFLYAFCLLENTRLIAVCIRFNLPQFIWIKYTLRNKNSETKTLSNINFISHLRETLG